MIKRMILNVAIALTVVTGLSVPVRAELTPDVRQQLTASTYVYIASQRKDGSFGKPAEIWFMYYQDAVWVGTPATSWRAKRLKAGRKTAQIAVGKLDGPRFEATGEIVTDPKAQASMLEIYGKKYPDGWKTFEGRFRDGFKDGSRVLIRYTPK